MRGAMNDNDNTPPTLPYAPHDAGRKRKDVAINTVGFALIGGLLLFEVAAVLFAAWRLASRV